MPESKTQFTMYPPEPPQTEMARAVYAEGVEQVYATHFNITLNQFECVIALGTVRPTEPGKEFLNIDFTHRVHLPPISAHMLQSAMANLIQAIASAQAAAQPDTSVN